MAWKLECFVRFYRILHTFNKFSGLLKVRFSPKQPLHLNLLPVALCRMPNHFYFMEKRCKLHKPNIYLVCVLPWHYYEGIFCQLEFSSFKQNIVGWRPTISTYLHACKWYYRCHISPFVLRRIELILACKLLIGLLLQLTWFCFH